jgi:hypothetical protein
MNRYFRSAAAVLTCFGFMLLGCGENEKLYDVSGTITFEGEPIPKGLIFFDPDSTKGTAGTQGFANIENGKFDTAAAGKGKGIRGGTYNIRISGFDGKEAPEAPFGKFLFPEEQLTKDLPKQNQTFDYDVKKKR